MSRDLNEVRELAMQISELTYFLVKEKDNVCICPEVEVCLVHSNISNETREPEQIGRIGNN